MLKYITIFLIIIESHLLAVDSSKMTEEKIEIFKNLEWRAEGTYKLSTSNSSISIPDGYLALTNQDAKLALETYGEPQDEIEALIISSDPSEPDNTIYFSYCNQGYISLDDWNEIDPKELFQGISENTEIANKIRIELGGSPMRLVGWIQEPSLDRRTNTVFWATEAANEDDSRIVNSVGLKLGRNGFESVVWSTYKSTYSSLDGTLDVFLRSHTFDPGFRYEDHTFTDNISPYGIATVVAAVAGGKIAKTGSLLAMFKKFAAPLLAILVGLIYKFKNIFKRNNDSP